MEELTFWGIVWAISKTLLFVVVVIGSIYGYDRWMSKLGDETDEELHRDLGGDPRKRKEVD